MKILLCFVIMLITMATTEAFKCRTYHAGIVGKPHDCAGNSYLLSNCHVTKTNGVSTSGCLLDGSEVTCGTRTNHDHETTDVCCCSTEECNTDEFIDACGYVSGGVKESVQIILFLAGFVLNIFYLYCL